MQTYGDEVLGTAVTFGDNDLSQDGGRPFKFGGRHESCWAVMSVEAEGLQCRAEVASSSSRPNRSSA